MTEHDVSRVSQVSRASSMSDRIGTERSTPATGVAALIAVQQDTEPNTVLVVETDPQFRETLRFHLRNEGYFVILAENGVVAIEMARQNQPTLLLLALQLRGFDSLEICRRLRQFPETEDIPIIALSAFSDEQERIAAFECGADDYVSKPFHWTELRARMRALLRRVSRQHETAMDERPSQEDLRLMTQGGITLDVDRRLVSRNGNPVQLNRRCFDLLAYLMRYQGIVLTRDRLLQHVWGYAFGGSERTVDVHIRWLREQLENDPSHPRLIETVHGVGYRFRGE